MEKGRIFNIQRFSTDDGEGIRTAVFFKGCPLHCVWCHNAEGISPHTEIACDQSACIGCGTCLSVCPQNALSTARDRIDLDRAKCIGCAACTSLCPTEALTTIGKTLTVEEILATVRRDRVFYGGKGGLTLTGGEPLSQATFALALAKAAKAEGISVAIETSGYGKTEDLLALAACSDCLLFDCKADAQLHEALTGVKDSLILENLDAVCRAGANVILRCPAVEGANMTSAFEEKILSIAQAFPAIRAVQLMPYHPHGREKPILLGKKAQPLFQRPSAEAIDRLAERITEKSGKKCFFTR